VRNTKTHSRKEKEAHSPNCSERPGLHLQAENGVWEAIIGPVQPGSYRYNFNVDGVG
jgi:hypothetical protein